MDSTYYLNLFQTAANQLDKKKLAGKKIETTVGIYQDSVFLKLYKTGWANKFPEPLSAESRIFFSVWINDKAIKESKLLYNIHALKLRQLSGYSIVSREFASAFRNKFIKFENHWPNVSTDFGPQTLMQGWVKADEGSFQDEIVGLAKQFLKIDHLIDNLLNTCKSLPARNKKYT